LVGKFWGEKSLFRGRCHSSGERSLLGGEIALLSEESRFGGGARLLSEERNCFFEESSCFGGGDLFQKLLFWGEKSLLGGDVTPWGMEGTVLGLFSRHAQPGDARGDRELALGQRWGRIRPAQSPRPREPCATLAKSHGGGHRGRQNQRGEVAEGHGLTGEAEPQCLPAAHKESRALGRIPSPSTARGDHPARGEEKIFWKKKEKSPKNSTHSLRRL